MNIWLCILLCSICFFIGYTFCFSNFRELAKTGELVVLKGKVYKLVEQETQE